MLSKAFRTLNFWHSVLKLKAEISSEHFSSSNWMRGGWAHHATDAHFQLEKNTLTICKCPSTGNAIKKWIPSPLRCWDLAGRREITSRHVCILVWMKFHICGLHLEGKKVGGWVAVRKRNIHWVSLAFPDTCLRVLSLPTFHQPWLLLTSN